MVNPISQELATAANSNPVSKQYIDIDYSKRPWPQSIVGNETALGTFRDKMKQPESIQNLSIRQYILYRLSLSWWNLYVMLFDRFGRAEVQFSNISISLQISVVENPNIATLYDEEPEIDYLSTKGEWRHRSIIFRYCRVCRSIFAAL